MYSTPYRPYVGAHKKIWEPIILGFQMHEANELFDGTLNVLHNSVLSTDVSTNEVYTYSQVMKQDDYADFLEAMSVEN